MHRTKGLKASNSRSSAHAPSEERGTSAPRATSRRRRRLRCTRLAYLHTDVDVDVHDVRLRDLSTGWFEALKDAPLVSLRLQPWAAWVAEYYPDRGGAAV